MTTLALVFFLMLAIVLMMSVGVLLGRKPIKGSCGGLSALGMKESCDICGGDQQRCDEETAKVAGQKAAALAYDATRNKSKS